MRNMRIWNIRVAALGAAAAVVFGFNAASPALVDYDEAAYARLVESTVASGQVRVPTIDGYEWFDKPPLYLWLLMVSRASGADTELSYRMPGILAGIACVMLVYALVASFTASRPIALFSAASLITSAGFVEAARQVRFDSLLLVWCLAAMYAVARAAAEPGREWQWMAAAGAFAGLAVMTKSVMGAFAGLFALTAVVGLRRFDLLRPTNLFAGISMAVLVAVPWHAAMTVLYGTHFWETYLGVHVRDRYVTDLFNNSASNIDYLRYIAEFGTPLVWVSLLCAGVAVTVVQTADPSRRMAGALSGCIILVALVFGTAQTKVFHYLVPLFPLCALLLGVSVHAIAAAPQLARLHAHRRWLANAAAAVCVVAGLATTATYGYHRTGIFTYDQALAEEAKAIAGVIMHERERELYLVSDAYWETVRYYSGASGKWLGENETVPPGALALIWNHGPAPRHSFSSSTEFLFEGEYLVLVHAR